MLSLLADSVRGANGKRTFPVKQSLRFMVNAA